MHISATDALNCIKLDLCGPFYVTNKNQTEGTLNKIYVCVFICFATKVIHIKVLSDLISETLVSVLKCFFSRCRKSATLHSGNATSMVDLSLSELKKNAKTYICTRYKFLSYLTSVNIEWKFILSKLPYFGGL